MACFVRAIAKWMELEMPQDSRGPRSSADVFDGVRWAEQYDQPASRITPEPQRNGDDKCLSAEEPEKKKKKKRQPEAPSAGNPSPRSTAASA